MILLPHFFNHQITVISQQGNSIGYFSSWLANLQLKMIANQQRFTCRRIITYFMGFLLLTVITSLMGYVSDFTGIQQQMDRINSNICGFTCGPPYIVDYNTDQCCSDYTYSSCVLKQACRKSQIDSLQGTYEKQLKVIIILSCTAAFLIGLIVFIRCKGRRQRALPPPIDIQAYQNFIQALIAASQRREDPNYQQPHYQSFSLNDLENTCAVCLQAFNEQRAVRLNCGHIFHSKCIKDWSKMKNTCPVCRARQ